MTELDALRAAERGVVAVLELERTTLEVTGPDAKSWLNGLVSCDLSSLDAAHGAYGLFLTKQGKIQSDADVLVGQSARGVALVQGAGPASLFVSLAPRTEETLFGILDRHLVMEDAELQRAPGVALLRLIGKGADAARAALESHPAVRALGTLDWLGLGGVAVAFERSAAEDVVRAALAAVGNGILASREAWDALRISRAFPEFGRDYAAEDNPHEASLEGLAVSFNKGCYLGQEVVCMQDMRGRVKRRLVALELGAGVHAQAGAEVTAAGSAEKIGEITSVARSGATVFGFARVRAPFFEPGTELRVGGASAARVALTGAE